MAIAVLSDLTRTSTGVGAFSNPPGGTPQIYVQANQPANTGMPYIWIQTGLANGGWTIWFHDGNP